MFKGIKYDVSLKKVRLFKHYNEEHEEMHKFCASEHKNMLFEYKDKREANNAYNYLKKIIIEEKMPLELHVHGGVNLLMIKKEKRE